MGTFDLKETMTQDMLEAGDTINERYLKKEFLYCHKMYEKCRAVADIKLPAVSASGKSVIVATKNHISIVASYWEIRRDLAKRLLPDEWVEEQGVSAQSFITAL